jgi:hypothetical protein
VTVILNVSVAVLSRPGLRNDLTLDVGVEGHEFLAEEEQKESEENREESELIDSPKPARSEEKEAHYQGQDTVDIEDSDSDDSDKDDDNGNEGLATTNNGTDDGRDKKATCCSKKPAKKRICIID